MQKQINVESLTEPVGYGYAYVIHAEYPNQIIGRILTLIEVMGLPTQQESATKDLIRQIVWDELSHGVYITPERHTAIRQEYEKKRAEIGNTVPMSAI